METTIIVIGVSVIAIFLLAIMVSKVSLAIFIMVQNIKYSLKAKKKMKKDKETWVRRKNYEEAIERQRRERAAYFQQKGYSSVNCSGTIFWLERDNSGKIKSLYDNERNRVPLANLTKAWGSKTIGTNPVLYYSGEKINRNQMLKDEAEIRKLNKNN